MPAVGVGISPFFGGLTPSEAVAYYTRVKAAGGTIDDFSALVGLTLDYQRIASLNPSLYTFASGRKAGTQYSLIPTDGSGDFSVTRSGTTGMELNARGYWQPVGENVPRYDYVSGVPMINIEEARTNLISRYKSFAHSDWIKSGASIQGDPNTAGVDIYGITTLPSGWSNPSGRKLIAAITTPQFQRAYFTPTLTAGKLYLVEYVVNSISGTYIINQTTGTGSDPKFINSTGSGYCYSLCTNSTHQLSIYPNSANLTIDIDITSVKEVTGYASPFVDANGANLMSGYKLVASSNNGYIRLATAATVTAATTYTSSIWIKRVTGTGQVYLIDTNTTDRAVTLTTDWQRFTYSAAAGTTSGQIGVKLAVSGDEVLIAHAQLEAGATASSPIGGAEGSTQTRNADAISRAVDYSGIKTLVINNDAYVVETSLPNNGYWLEQVRHSRLVMFNRTLSDAEITVAGWTKRQLAFAASVNIAAGTSISIEVNGSGYIDWGDGTTDSYSSQVTKTHIYTGGYRGLIKFVGTLTRFNTSSSANWYFNLSSLPTVMTYFYCTGSNTIAGNLSSLPSVMTTFNCAGSNTITGNLSSLSSNLTSFNCTGSSTVTGNLSSLPSALTLFGCAGSNTITGNLSSLPTNLTTFYCAGSNTITGNLSSLPAGLTQFNCLGNNTIADYTAGRTWSNSINYIYIRQASGYGLSSLEVDNLLIDLALATWSGSSRTVDVRGVNAARTSASDAAVATLVSKSVTVLTN